MMGKLVTEDKGHHYHSSHKYISPIEVEIRIEEAFVVGSEIMLMGDAHRTIKTLQVETGVTFVIEEITDATQEVVRDTGTIIMTIGETTIEVKVMKEIGVGH